ncbi:hypothetical protein Thein_1957 [Thermodesulfatator indicus DSM 15286]|uniref:Lipoprotein n=1 Tax=Thermodesulfatator indicus (strain DSM 15286 / JCM 11887 / CIR29812) TaxID=667014 RepID=F8ACN6_THEID|nr:hypothetical protein [Thermodesulfatator indicus]AEH45811.1 hypothetical protein Thein_1957 [Thermodesulfatator indicus DSM 15286]
MKKIFLLFLFFLVTSLATSCTTGKQKPINSPETLSAIRNINFTDDRTDVGLLIDKKNYLIIFSSPVSGNQKEELTVLLNLPRGKEEEFLKWTETGELSDDLFKKVRISLGRKPVRDPETVRAVIQSLYRSRAYSFPYFYILGRNGRVAEIQGVDDYLRLIIASHQKNLPDFSFLRNQISIAGMMDIMEFHNEGSKILGAKLGFKMPFFLAIDSAISAMGLTHDIWKHLTRDSRAEKFLKSGASDRDRCLMILTDPGKEILKDSEKGLHEVISYCSKYLQRENPAGQELVRVAKAEGRAFAILYFVHKKKNLPAEEVRQVLSTIEEANKYARNYTERRSLNFIKKFIRKNASASK